MNNDNLDFLAQSQSVTEGSLPLIADLMCFGPPGLRLIPLLPQPDQLCSISVIVCLKTLNNYNFWQSTVNTAHATTVYQTDTNDGALIRGNVDALDRTPS